MQDCYSMCSLSLSLDLPKSLVPLRSSLGRSKVSSPGLVSWRYFSTDSLLFFPLTIGFQEDLEKGKSSHLFPAMFAKERVKNGQMKEEDVPYMQRGGMWDNSDVKGAKKKGWNETDKKMKAIPSWLRRGLAP